jgi:hypothetical protein
MKQVFVDSRDRASGTPSNFILQLPSTLVLQQATRGRIDDLRVPVTIPTIQAGVNDTITFRMGSTNYLITIPEANYDGVGLASQLQSLLTSTAPGSWTCTYYTNRMLLSITCTNAWTITGGTYGSKLLSRSYYYNNYTYNFYALSVQGADVLYLCSPNLTNSNSCVGPKGSHDVLMSVVITCPFGSVQDASMSTSVWFDIPALSTQTLSFTLRDRDYNILNIVPNISFTLSIDA